MAGDLPEAGDLPVAEPLKLTPEPLTLTPPAEPVRMHERRRSLACELARASACAWANVIGRCSARDLGRVGASVRVKGEGEREGKSEGDGESVGCCWLCL